MLTMTIVDGIRKCKKLSPEYARIDSTGHVYTSDNIQNAYNWMLWDTVLGDIAEELGVSVVVGYHRKWAKLWMEDYDKLRNNVFKEVG